MNIVRIIQVCIDGWRDSKAIATSNANLRKTRLQLYRDILSCFFLYRIRSSQYVKEEFFMLDDNEKKVKGKQLSLLNKERDKWYRRYFKTQKFLCKYTSMRYSTSLVKQYIRNKKYKEFYKWGETCWVHNNVVITCEHNHEGKITMGKEVVISNNVEIDYTGDLAIGNGVDIMDGTKILTHAHDFFGGVEDSDFIPESNRAFCTPLVIGDNVLIGSRSFIMPGVKSIGENSIISAGSFVKKKVPANVIVAGNPAKIVGEISEGNRKYFAYKH